MGLFGYNRMLAWVVAPLIIWALIGMSMALGATHRGPGHSRYRLAWRLEDSPHALVVPGRLRRVEELQDRLILTVELPEKERPRDLRPGAGLEVKFVDPGALPAKPLELNMQGEMRAPRELRRGRKGLLSRQFLLIFDDKSIKILPRPGWMHPGPPRRPEEAAPGGLAPGQGGRQPEPGQRFWQRRQDRGGRQPGGYPPNAPPGGPESRAPRERQGGDSGREGRGKMAPQWQ